MWCRRAIGLVALVALGACAPGSFRVTASGTHVTISPTGVVQVKDKATQAFTVTPDADHKVVSTVTGSCPAGSWNGNVYTTGRIVANCWIGFSAALETFSVSSSGSHVAILPEGTQTVAAGTGQAFSVTPDVGYTTVSTVGGTCPAGTWAGAVYTTGAVTSDCSVTFSATPNTYQVTASGDSCESIAPGAPQTVGFGATPAFNVTAHPGCTTSSTVGGTCPAGTWSGSVYTTGPITADCSVTFSGTLQTHQVTVSGDSFEAITPATPQTVNDGATQAYTVIPNTGYQLSSAVGGTCPAGSWSGAVYTTGAITADCAVSFSGIRVFQVTPSGDSNETITPSTAQTVVVGQTQAFTVTPHTGYQLSSAVGGTCPAGSWSGAVYTTGAIIADCVVSFSGIRVFQVTPSGDSNEMITPSTAQTVVAGQTQAFTVIANHDRALSATVGGSCPTGTWSGAVYTTGAITADCAVSFSATPVVVVTAGSDAHVSISPSGTTQLQPGSTQSFTVTPMTGEAASFVPGGTCPPGTWSGSVYTTGAITADCSITFTGVTPVLQPGTLTGGSSTVVNVAGAPDTVQMTFADLNEEPYFFAAQWTATTDTIVRFNWALDVTAGLLETMAVESSSTGPQGQSTVALLPIEKNVSYGTYSGTTSVTLRAGYPFEFVVLGYGGAEGTLTVSTIEEAPDALLTASGDSNETVTPAQAVVRAGTTPAFTVTTNTGSVASSTVGGTCPPGRWNGREYLPGPITADCSLLFSSIPGTDNSDAGVDAGVVSTENTLGLDVSIRALFIDCAFSSRTGGDPNAAYAKCVTACNAGSELSCEWAQIDLDAGAVAPDAGPMDAGPADAGTVDAGPTVVASLKLDTDPAFYTALDWASQLWPDSSGVAWQNLSAELSVINLDETLTFDSPPTLDMVTGDLTFATTPGTYGTATVLATAANGGDAASGGLAPAAFTITVNTPSWAPDVSVRSQWRSPCIPVVFEVIDPNESDYMQLALLTLPTQGFLMETASAPLGIFQGPPFSVEGAMVPEFQRAPGDFEQTVCYVPFSQTWTGFDSFTYSAVDDHGSKGTPAVVSIQVFQN